MPAPKRYIVFHCLGEETSLDHKELQLCNEKARTVQVNHHGSLIARQLEVPELVCESQWRPEGSVWCLQSLVYRVWWYRIWLTDSSG